MLVFFWFFLKSSPRYFLLAAALFSIRKTTLLLIMILPWKILSSIINTREKISVDLFFLIFFSVVIHFLSGRAFSRTIDMGANRFYMLRANKSAFNGCRDLSFKTYKYISFFFSALLYAVFCFLIIFFLYRELVFFVLLYVSFFASSVFFMRHTFFNLKSKVRHDIYKLWWLFGFFIAITFVVVQVYFYRLHLNWFPVFVAVLTARQLFIVVTSLLDKYILIHSGRGQYNILYGGSFFDIDISVKRNLTKIEDLIINLSNRDSLELFIRKNIGVESSSDFLVRLSERSTVGYIFSSSKSSEGYFVERFIKVYSPKKDAYAEQEYQILCSLKNFNFSPKVAKIEFIEEFYIFVLYNSNEWRWLSISEKKTYLNNILFELIEVVLPNNLIELDKLRENGLISRVECIDWSNLSQFSGENKYDFNWADVQLHIAKIIEIIESLPKQLYFYSLNDRPMLIVREQVILADLSNWGWEPIGTGWPINLLNELPEVLCAASSLRSELVNVRVATVRYVARLYELEKRYSNKNYLGAISVLRNLLKDFEKYQ